MTNSQTYYLLPSANEIFKSRYTTVLRWSLLAALLLTALIFWLVPDIPSQPYVMREVWQEILPPIPDAPDVPFDTPLPPPVIPKEIVAVPYDVPLDPNLISIWEPDQPSGPMAPVYQEPGMEFVASSSNPVLLTFARPDYPEVARLSGLEGQVLVKVLVNKNGQVDQVVVLKGVHPLLDRAAVNAARRCKFKPGTQRTIPVRAWLAIPYNFRLH